MRVFAATTLIAIVGAIDDIHHCHRAATATADSCRCGRDRGTAERSASRPVSSVVDRARAPAAGRRLVVNIVNFMDGID
jgi:hypothetical protein